MSYPFAVPSELSAFMGEEIPEETARLNLAVVSGAIRSYCGWSVSAETVVDQRVRCHSGARSIWLPTLYLRSVETLAYSATYGALSLLAGTQFEWTTEGRVSLLFGWQTGGEYVCSYSHGYLDTHPAIETCKGVCLSAAARATDNPLSRRSEATGAESFVAAGAGADVIAMLAQGERGQLDPYRLPVLG